MNILTFDIEEWYLEKAYFGAKESVYYKYDRLLDQLLEKLDASSLKGTFFCVGKLATDFPHVVRKIVDAGHEVGCHSNTHQWLNKMTYEDAMADTRAAIDALEQCVGKKVESYRAPAFSICGENKWAFEVLAANGIKRDASVFPASRDFGGFPGLKITGPTILKYNGVEIHEYPIATMSICGKDCAYSGGGFFRFFPLWMILQEMRTVDYSMAYFHLGDLYPVISGLMTRSAYEQYFNAPGDFKSRLIRLLKTNVGTKTARKKLFKLLEREAFCNISQAEGLIDWDKVPVVLL